MPESFSHQRSLVALMPSCKPPTSSTSTTSSESQLFSPAVSPAVGGPHIYSEVMRPPPLPAGLLAWPPLAHAESLRSDSELPASGGITSPHALVDPVSETFPVRNPRRGRISAPSPSSAAASVMAALAASATAPPAASRQASVVSDVGYLVSPRVSLGGGGSVLALPPRAPAAPAGAPLAASASAASRSVSMPSPTIPLVWENQREGPT